MVRKGTVRVAKICGSVDFLTKPKGMREIVTAMAWVGARVIKKECETADY